MDYFVKWREAYSFTKSEFSAVAEALITNLFCRYGVLRELHRPGP
jgi:hypothetical protein